MYVHVALAADMHAHVLVNMSSGVTSGAQLTADAYWSEVTAQDELPLYEGTKFVQATAIYSDMSCAGA